jgi:hypothetical protein
MQKCRSRRGGDRMVVGLTTTGVPGENDRSVANHSQTQSHNVVSSTPRHL